MDNLIARHIELVRNVDTSFERYLSEELPWNERLIGIKGSRGTGKTTLLLQYIKKNYQYQNSALYLSLDDLYFAENSLLEVVKTFVSNGGKHLFLDEVHKYKEWSRTIKQIYDTYHSLKIVFTGSSLLEILNARSDLSRRALVYHVKGLSYREHLELNHNILLPKLSLKDILDNHIDIVAKIGHPNILGNWKNYLSVGYFPFYNGNETIYHKRLVEIINMIVEIELPQLRNTDISIVHKIKKLLYIISQSVPFKPNISSLAEKIKTNRKTIIEYINYLTDAEVINTIHRDKFGVSALQKPEKLYLGNTNYMHAILHQPPNIGSLRETFFLSQLSTKHSVTYPESGDFLVDDQYLFEIGGKNKKKYQLKDNSYGYLALDDINIGLGNKIPLWLFGLLY